jgi:hypothetical protein
LFIRKPIAIEIHDRVKLNKSGKYIRSVHLTRMHKSEVSAMLRKAGYWLYREDWILWYYVRFTVRFGLEWYRSARTEVFSTLGIAVITFVLSKQSDTHAADALLVTAKACGIWLVGFGFWHLVRVPWLLYKERPKQAFDDPNLEVNWGGIIYGPVYLSEDGVWSASSTSSSAGNGYSSVRLQVRNLHIHGKKVGAAKNVSGRVEFTHDTGVPGWTAAPAAWLNEQLGKITVDLDHDKELILAVRVGKEWNVVSNVRRNDGLPTDKTAMQFREAPWFNGTMKVSVIHDGEAETTEYKWDDSAQSVVPRIRPI